MPERDPDFLKLCPNNKVPVIVDRDGPGGTPLSVFESGAILEYLADKTGRLLPADGAGRYKVIEWLHLIAANLSPALGQAHYFVTEFPEGNQHAADRFRNETARVFRVLEGQLAAREWIATAEYSIADISAYGRVRGWKNAGVQIDDTPRLKAWLQRMEDRPAVLRADAVIGEMRAGLPKVDKEETQSILYGARQMAGR